MMVNFSPFAPAREWETENHFVSMLKRNLFRYVTSLLRPDESSNDLSPNHELKYIGNKFW